MQSLGEPGVCDSRSVGVRRENCPFAARAIFTSRVPDEPKRIALFARVRCENEYDAGLYVKQIWLLSGCDLSSPHTSLIAEQMAPLLLIVELGRQ